MYIFEFFMILGKMRNNNTHIKHIDVKCGEY